MALGALIIQEREGFSDRHLIQHISENPYLQYFIGLKGYQEEPPFDPSLMTYFRKRLGPDVVNRVNEWIVLAEKQDDQDKDDPTPPEQGNADDDSQGESQEPITHQGKLILDATCAPADMAYPTDLSLLGEAREKLEEIIDTLHAPHKGKMKKPRDPSNTTGSGTNTTATNDTNATSNTVSNGTNSTTTG
jgi:transposase, IS5 family